MTMTWNTLSERYLGSGTTDNTGEHALKAVPLYHVYDPIKAVGPSGQLPAVLSNLAFPPLNKLDGGRAYRTVLARRDIPASGLMPRLAAIEAKPIMDAAVDLLLLFRIVVGPIVSGVHGTQIHVNNADLA